MTESYVAVGTTEGLLRIENGLMIARITVFNQFAPEIPLLQVTEDVGWKYTETSISVRKFRVLYEFEIPNENHAPLHSIVWFFDTLYGESSSSQS